MTLVMEKKNRQLASTSSSFDEIFLTHYDRVYGILFRLMGNRAEAEELAQEVFCKLYENRPTMPDSKIGAWLYRVATNTGYNAIRTRKRSLLREQKVAVSEVDESADPAKQHAINETRQLVRQALAKLTPQQGQLLLLKQMDFSYKEIAEVCDLNPKSVGKNLSRAADAFKVAYLSVAKEHPHV